MFEIFSEFYHNKIQYTVEIDCSKMIEQPINEYKVSVYRI